MAYAIRILGVLTYVIGGLLGLGMSLGIMYDLGGILLAGVSLLLAPPLLIIAPWYSGFANGDWSLLFITYGSAIASTAMIILSAAIEASTKSEKSLSPQ